MKDQNSILMGRLIMQLSVLFAASFNTSGICKRNDSAQLE
jgi:hypothetical protein